MLLEQARASGLVRPRRLGWTRSSCAASESWLSTEPVAARCLLGREAGATSGSIQRRQAPPSRRFRQPAFWPTRLLLSRRRQRLQPPRCRARARRGPAVPAALRFRRLAFCSGSSAWRSPAPLLVIWIRARRSPLPRWRARSRWRASGSRRSGRQSTTSGSRPIGRPQGRLPVACVRNSTAGASALARRSGRIRRDSCNKSRPGATTRSRFSRRREPARSACVRLR
jgi:hypothetical protein